MDKQEQADSQDILTPKEIAEWAKQEVLNSAKAFELRVKEAMALATQFASGEITPEMAKQRLVSFDHRWGEAMYGARVGESTTDDQLLTRIDEVRRQARLSVSQRTLARNMSEAQR